MMILLVILVAIVAAEVANIFITRIPCDISMLSLDCRCIKCDKKVNPLKKLGLTGIFFRCKECNSRLVGIRNLIVLLVSVGFFILCYYWFIDDVSKMVLSMIFIEILIAITFTDIDVLWIPDRYHVAVLILAIVGMFFKFPIWYHGLIGCLIGGGLFFIIASIMNPRAQKKYGEDVLALGLGDVKMMAVCGLFLGYKAIILTIVFGSIIGLLIEIPRRKLSKSEEINFAFGPYLAIGMVIALFFGEIIIDAYLNILGGVDL